MDAPLRPQPASAPKRTRQLPVDDRGYPMPEFVSRLGGQRDCRVVSLDHLAKCIREDVCWICGQPLEALKALLIGPLPALRGISNEPPSHIECAERAGAGRVVQARRTHRAQRGAMDASPKTLRHVGYRRSSGAWPSWFRREADQPLESESTSFSSLNHRIHSPATTSVPTPPSTTAGTVPNHAAVTPDSNSPS